MEEMTYKTDDGKDQSEKEQKNGTAKEEEEETQDPKTTEGKKEDVAKPERFTKEFKYKVVKTGSLVALWITVGCLNSISGTTNVDFYELLHTTYETLAIVGIFSGVLSLLGTIIAAALRDKVGVQPELLLVAGGLIVSTSAYIKPWTRSIELYRIVSCTWVFSLGWMNTIANALLVAIWGSKASTPVHAFHFGYGLGAFLGPLVAKDFLSLRCSKTNQTLELPNMDVAALCANDSKENIVILEPGRLEIPYSIMGTVALVVSLSFLVYYSLERWSGWFRQLSVAIMNDKKEQVVEGEDEKNKQQPLKFFLPFAVGLFFLYFCINSFEGVIYYNLFTFAFESDLFDKDEASLLSSAYWGCYLSSRFAAIWIAHFVSVKIMIFVEMTATLGSLVGMYVLGFRIKTAMWVFSCLVGVFVAPIWPSGIAFADRYVTVKAYVVSATDVGAGISGSLFSWVAARFVDFDMVHSYFFVAIAGCSTALLLIIIMQVMGHKHGDRHLKAASDKVKGERIFAEAEPWKEEKSI